MVHYMATYDINKKNNRRSNYRFKRNAIVGVKRRRDRYICVLLVKGGLCSIFTRSLIVEDRYDGKY